MDVCNGHVFVIHSYFPMNLLLSIVGHFFCSSNSNRNIFSPFFSVAFFLIQPFSLHLIPFVISCILHNTRKAAVSSSPDSFALSVIFFSPLWQQKTIFASNNIVFVWNEMDGIFSSKWQMLSIFVKILVFVCLFKKKNLLSFLVFSPKIHIPFFWRLSESK